jgi:hypothetical protein
MFLDIGEAGGFPPKTRQVFVVVVFLCLFLKSEQIRAEGLRT